MGAIHFITIGTIALSGLLPASCSKSSSASKPVPAVSKAASANEKDLGVLQLTNRYEIRVQLGAGKSCTIKPNRIDHKNVRLTMSLESRNADGKTQGLSVMNVVTASGQQCEVNIGGMDLTLTPQLATE